MTLSTASVWGNRITHIALALLLLATVSGVFLGATVTMYYDVVPDMGSLEDDLGALPLLLYLLAALVSLAHLPLALWDLRHRQWRQASMRGAVVIGPLVVFFGTEGLVSHLLWWDPISDTDRFHLLHHALVAGVPLLAGYWLLVRWWWRPATFAPMPSPSRKAWLISAIILTLPVMAVGVLLGLVTPPFFVAATVAGLAATAGIVFWMR